MGRKSKLTEGQWDGVKGRLDSGESMRSVGRSFGVSSAAIKKHFGHAVVASYVYIITADQFDGIYKIGVTDNIKRRISDMQTGCPYKLYAERVFPVDQPLFVERMLHAFFYKKRMAGEWFRLSGEDIQYIENAVFDAVEVLNG